MAVTKPDKNKALAALTTAALSLPGLNATAAVPAAQIETNVSYGHYQESDNRMQVDVYHADAVIPLSDRIELAFSMDRDTYSGATPAFSMPASMTNQPKYKQKDDGTPSSEVSYADVVSAASGGVTAAGLTLLGGLNAFQSFQDGNTYAQSKITAYNNRVIEELILETDTSLTAIDEAEAAAMAPFTAQYDSDTKALKDQLDTYQTSLESQYNADKTSLRNQYITDTISLESQYIDARAERTKQYNNDLLVINPDIPALDAAYKADIAKLDASYAAELAKLNADYEAANANLAAAHANEIATLDANKASYIAGNPKPLDPASISSPAVIDFNTGMTQSSYGGFANVAPIAGGACPGSGSSGCFYQNGMVVGIVQDSSNPTAHLHRAGTAADRKLSYHADSSGIYIRSLDSKAFSLGSMDFLAPINPEGNPDSGPNDFWQILGFNTALNPGLATGDGTNYATRVAYQQVANGFSGKLTPYSDLNSDNINDFNNISAFWIHYNGYPQTPKDGKEFSMTLDNIAVSPVVLPTSEQVTWDSDLANYINTIYEPGKAAATATRDTGIVDATATRDTGIVDATKTRDTGKAAVTATYNANLAELTAGQEAQYAALKNQYDADLAALSTTNSADQAALTNAYNEKVAALSASYDTQKAAANSAYESQMAAVNATYDSQISAVSATHDAQRDAANANYEAQLKEQKAKSDELTKRSQIALYRALVDSQIPTGTPIVQVFQVQPQETRTMPQFTAKYYFDTTTLAASGGFSDEPDFLSNFGSLNVSHEFNDKLTTVSGGYGMTSNTITRNSGGHYGTGHDEHYDSYGPTNYADLNESSTFHSFNTSIAQVLSKNTLFQSTPSYTHQSGYLSNPYKFVYVRGEITPEEYYQMYTASDTVDWNAVTNLEVVGTELFREVRPEQRNIFSLSNRINHYLPELDASVHFDYRYYTDDWGINSHAFELKWYQSLPYGFIVTPGIRYYSQSQADFFAPYFLSPRADGNYSSDFRLSAFGDLSTGLTISKQFARGINLEIGAEYVTHSGSLRLGGGGVDDYANFNYYLAHANLNVDLSAPKPAGGEHSGHHMHHHGAPVPAGVMYGHMMNQANEIMVGFRYMWSGQSGSMLKGSNKVNNETLVSNACEGLPNGCLYKPESMNMSMYMLDLMYAPTDWLNIMLMPQLMSMDMKMSDPIRPYASPAEESEFGGHGGVKHYSNDLGDTVVTALVKVLDNKGQHVHVGLGISAPTGGIDAEISPPNYEARLQPRLTPVPLFYKITACNSAAAPGILNRA